MPESQVPCPNLLHEKNRWANPPADKSVTLGQETSLGEELGDSLGFNQFARLIEVIVNNRLGIDTEGVINRGQ